MNKYVVPHASRCAMRHVVCCSERRGAALRRLVTANAAECQSPADPTALQSVQHTKVQLKKHCTARQCTAVRMLSAVLSAYAARCRLHSCAERKIAAPLGRTCALHAACGLVHRACCLLHVARCMLHVVCCIVFVARSAAPADRPPAACSPTCSRDTLCHTTTPNTAETNK